MIKCGCMALRLVLVLEVTGKSEDESEDESERFAPPAPTSNHARETGAARGPALPRSPTAYLSSVCASTKPSRLTLTRRIFLKRIGIAGIGASLGAFVPGTFGEVLGRAGVSLPRSTPEAEGVASSGILAFLDGIAHTKSELHSFMMVRHGRV